MVPWNSCAWWKLVVALPASDNQSGEVPVTRRRQRTLHDCLAEEQEDHRPEAPQGEIQLPHESGFRFPQLWNQSQRTRANPVRTQRSSSSLSRSRWHSAWHLPYFFQPACLKTLFNVPGGRSSLGFPATVTRPGFVVCLNCRWLPLVATRYQPSSLNRASTSATFTR